MKISLRLVVFLFCAISLYAQDPRSQTATDFFRHEQKGKSFELWNYQFFFSNGTQAYLTYSLVEVPALGKKITAELSFVNFQGKNDQVGKQFPTSDWKESIANKQISIREGYFMKGLPGNGHRVRFGTSKNEGFYLELSFTDVVPTLIPPAQSLQGIPIQEVVHIPSGKVMGRIAIGKDTITVEGVGNLVHTWYPKPLNELASRSISIYESSSYVYAGQVFQGTNQNELAGYVVKVSKGIPIILSPKKIKIKGSSALIEWNHPEEILWALDFSQPIQKYSALATVDSWMERQAAKVALGGDRTILRGKTPSMTGTLHWVATGFDAP
jgi:hypothetical protein